jgi:hypothetical protein
MKIAMILKAINRHAGIHASLALFFAFCWMTHHVAFLKMEGCGRQFALMNDRTMRVMALIDWVTAHSWLVIAYTLLPFASVAFLQIRGRPPWTCWVVVVVYCIPCVMYWSACAYIAGKLIGPMT